MRTYAVQWDDPMVWGAGWHCGFFGIHNLTRAVLDAVVPDRPCLIYDSNFHNACINVVALSMAGIWPDTPDLQNGHFVRDADGRTTSMLHDDAIYLVIKGLLGTGEDTCRKVFLSGVQRIGPKNPTRIPPNPSSTAGSRTAPPRRFPPTPMRRWAPLWAGFRQRGWPTAPCRRCTRSHIVSWRVRKTGPDRAPWTYSLRSILDRCAPYCINSDWAVTTLNPFEIIGTAITREPLRHHGRAVHSRRGDFGRGCGAWLGHRSRRTVLARKHHWCAATGIFG